MIALGRTAARAAGVDDRLTLLHTRIPGPPPASQSFDAVLSKDLLHHLPDPRVLWNEVTRLGRPGAAVYVMDSVRPDSEDTARAMVKEGAGSEHPILQHDFYQSLLAAFTMDEVRTQVADRRARPDSRPDRRPSHVDQGDASLDSVSSVGSVGSKGSIGFRSWNLQRPLFSSARCPDRMLDIP